MKKILLFSIIFWGLISCSKETIYPDPCFGGCNATFNLIYKDKVIDINPQGYYEIEWGGLGYFQIKGELSKLNPYYVINKIPLIEVNFDTDYWILLDTIRFSTPMYSYLGWFNNRSFTNPIPIGNYVYTIEELSKNHTPLNIAGYQIQKNFCFKCPYAPTLLGSNSKYNYNPQQNILLDNEMVGDTISVFAKVVFNNDLGKSETINSIFKVVIK
jgi:hypothetical protein